MKIFADMNISLGTVEWFRSQGHEATHARELGLQRAPDEDILITARREHSVLLTMDLDFGYLMAASGGCLPSVILLRLGNETCDAVNRRLAAVLNLRDIDWSNGLFVTVTDTSLRVRRLPL